MIATAGSAGVLVALASSFLLVVQGARAFFGKSDRSGMRFAVWGLAGGAILAMAALEVALLSDDFSIRYVAENHSRDTPVLFTIASAWAALEGSIVLWGLVLAGYAAFLYRTVRDDDPQGAGALAVVGMVAVFFFGLMVTAADPFVTLADPPMDGRGANPLLLNHILMAVHPPMLYLGYVGMTVPFAFAIAALAAGEGGTAWLQRTRRWSVVAWTFLTLGILLGGWWSYEVLGWGGYWAWDPVENASFLPWLTATAFIHSAVVQRRRGVLEAWNIALVIATFALTILGTFLTRSGVVASVHSFTQSAVGPALLGFLFVVMIGSFTLFAARAHLVASTPRLDSLASREGVFLANNLLLTLFAFVVLLGTLYPLFVEAFSGQVVAVGAPWFDRMAVPISLTLLLAMGIGPLTPYRRASWRVLWPRLRAPLQIAAVVAVVAVVLGMRAITPLAVVALASFIIAGIVRHAFVTRSGKSVLGLLRSDPGYWGGQLSHIGVALVAVAICFSSSFDTRTELTVGAGETVDFDGYELTYVSPFLRNEPNRQVLGARFELSRDGDLIAVLEPRLNQYRNQVQAIATPAVHTGLREDVYLSLVRIDTDDGSASVDAYRFPLVWMLWAGGLVIVAGATLSVTLRRARRHVVPEAVDVRV